MTRKAFILSFDRDDELNYVEIHKMITGLPIVLNWFHYVKSSYILITNVESATNLNHEILKIFVDKEFLLMEVNIINRNGWLPEKAWDWIRRESNK